MFVHRVHLESVLRTMLAGVLMGQFAAVKESERSATHILMYGRMHDSVLRAKLRFLWLSKCSSEGEWRASAWHMLPPKPSAEAICSLR